MDYASQIWHGIKIILFQRKKTPRSPRKEVPDKSMRAKSAPQTRQEMKKVVSLFEDDRFYLKLFNYYSIIELPVKLTETYS